MKRSEIVLPEYFDRYINKCDDVSILEALQQSLKELENVPVEKWKQLGDKVYAPGKWTIREMLQHLIDTERVFSYRATAFSRGDENVMSYDEDLYAQQSRANERSLEEILEEAIILRKSFICLYQSFNEAMLNRTGNGFKGKYSVASIGFIIPGHQRWHFDILAEKYYPLI